MNKQTLTQQWPRTWNEIAELYDVSIRTLYNWRKRHGLSDIPKGHLRPCDVIRIFEKLGNPYDHYKISSSHPERDRAMKFSM